MQVYVLLFKDIFESFLFPLSAWEINPISRSRQQGPPRDWVLYIYIIYCICVCIKRTHIIFEYLKIFCAQSNFCLSPSFLIFQSARTVSCCICAAWCICMCSVGACTPCVLMWVIVACFFRDKPAVLGPLRALSSGEQWLEEILILCRAPPLQTQPAVWHP